MTTRPTRRRLTDVIVEVLLVVAILVVMAPLAWLAFLSIQPNRSIIRRDWSVDFWTGNFTGLFAEESVFRTQVLNSVVITVVSVLACLAIGLLGAYAISKLSPPKWLLYPSVAFAAVLPVIPPITLLPGLLEMLSRYSLAGSLAGLILLNILFNLPFAVLFLKVYIDVVPSELREAGMLDGAPERLIFLRLIVPIVKPGIAATVIFISIMVWNEFLFGLTMTSGGETAPLTVGIASLVQPYQVTWGEMAAAGTVAVVPIIIAAVVANKQIVAGLSGGAVKG